MYIAIIEYKASKLIFPRIGHVVFLKIYQPPLLWTFIFIKMLGTFPKDFFPSGIFPSGNFPSISAALDPSLF